MQKENKLTVEELVLKKGTLHCPRCKEQLLFECYGPMRVKREANGQMVYNAQCKKDNLYFFVKAPHN